MAPVYKRGDGAFDRLFADHASEAVSILTMEPSLLIRRLILVLAALLFTGIVWSFVGRLDTIVQTSGAIRPESQELRVFVPIKGQLADLYVAEGMLVSKDDVVARVNSPSAIELASQATAAQYAMQAAQRKLDAFPEERKASELQIKALSIQIASEEASYERNISESLAKLAVSQSLKLEKAKAKVAKADEDRQQARRELGQFQRLFDSPGGGGVSGDQVEEKRKALRDKEIDYQLAQVELSEFEVALSDETAKKKEDIEKKSQTLVSLQSQYEALVQRLAVQERELHASLRMAKAKARASARIQYEDIDDDNFLLIRAPADGVVVQITTAQVGNQVDDKSPIVAIASKDDRKILEVQINERDRAFLTPGMPVKIKVNAFAYQRYGFIEGELEHIAPSTVMDPQSKRLVYTGRVALNREHFVVNEVKTPIRYGMTANAEIVVRKRRIIDLALDPLRNVGA